MKANSVFFHSGPVYEGEMYEEEFKGQRDAGVLGLIEQIRGDSLARKKKKKDRLTSTS